MNESAVDILKSMQLVLESAIEDGARQLHNLEALSANLGYVIALLEEKP